jgi:hypothetical protein
MFWGWSDEGVKDPGLFDYNDGFTPEQAGSPASGSSEYPLKELWGVDNTCRFTYGFEPDGSEPGVCPIPVTPTPSQTPSTTPTPTITPTPTSDLI